MYIVTIKNTYCEWHVTRDDVTSRFRLCRISTVGFNFFNLFIRELCCIWRWMNFKWLVLYVLGSFFLLNTYIIRPWVLSLLLNIVQHASEIDFELWLGQLSFGSLVFVISNHLTLNLTRRSPIVKPENVWDGLSGRFTHRSTDMD